MRLGAIILTGGASRRMGRPKESLPFLGGTMLGQVSATLLQGATPVVVIRRQADQELPPLPPAIDVIEDAEPAAGPLAAIVTGLRWLRDRHAFAAADAAFVTGCDLPFLSVKAVRWLAARLADAPLVMPRVAGQLQPLAAIYRLSVLTAAETLLQAGVRAPHRLGELPGARIVDEAAWRELDPDLCLLTNVNTPIDLARAIARLQCGGNAPTTPGP